MKKFVTLMLAAGLLLSAQNAQAIDFKASGEWLVGFTGGQGGLLNKTRSAEAGKAKANSNDKFEAGQRIRLQLDAVASENLSGTVFFEIGDTTWGKNSEDGEDHGGALGADGKIVELKNAYLDWTVPDTPLKVRMGIQALALPNVAGGSSIFDDDVAGVAASYQFNDNVGLTLTWMRPFNDNYDGTPWGNNGGNARSNYLDNVDLIALSVPLTFDGVELTPWIMFGIIGQNAFAPDGDGATYFLSGYEGDRWRHAGDVESGIENRTSSANNTAFWAGLPIKLSLWDPFNVELDINYGYVGSQGRGDIVKAGADGVDVVKRYDTQRQGWLVKALVEYSMEWGTPGIFGWYASGDDSNPKNGSERMPAVSPSANFTSFFGDGNLAWSSSEQFYDRSLSYAGTWGIGIQIADMSFLENLKHTFRAVLRGGTNSPSMAKYAGTSWGWSNAFDSNASTDYDSELYLTTRDQLIEFNLVNSWKMYENLEVNFELGYIINMIDHDTWKKAGTRNTSFQKQDAWKAQLVFAYTF